MSNSEAILANARKHFDKLRKQSVEVPEWGDDSGPLVANFDPATLRQRQEIEKRSGNSEARRLALAVILLLKDDSGNPVFEDDAVSLNTLESAVDSQVVARVAQTVLGLTDGKDLGNSSSGTMKPA